MKRRTFLLKSGAVLAAANSFVRHAFALPTVATKRNLLFITVDDMNCTLPGFMGGKNNLTPSLDALSASSHRFIQNRTTAPICQPSREAMMTGLLPHHSGGLGFTPVHEGTPTLVTLLKSQGYFTAGIHKLEHMQPPSCFPWDMAVEGMGRAPSEYASAVQQAIDKARAADMPFFINCNINDPHRPFYGSPQAATVDHHEQGEYQVAREITADEVEVPPFLEDLPDVRRELAQYQNSAQRMDRSIGKVLAALAASPEAKNTIIFFSADHGMPFPFSKATVYDNGTRTPALLRYPGMGKPKSFPDRTCNIDYMPTLLDLLHSPAPAGMDGKSWFPLLHGEHQAGREFLVTHVNSVNSGTEYPMRALQDDRYSLIFMPWSDGKLKFRIESMQGLTYPAMKAASQHDEKLAARLQQFDLGVPLALYDLQSDPGQRLNLLDQPQHKSRAEIMKARLLESMKRTADPQLGNFEAYLRGKPMSVIQAVKKQVGPE
jgi:N-sulfoglucosamine sulfohydrolase